VSEQEETTIHFECIYCMQECDSDIQVALIRNPGGEEEEGTLFFAHYGCFQRSLHPKRAKALDALMEVKLDDDE